VLVKEECGGAPRVLQKGLTTDPGSSTPGPGVTVTPVPPTTAPGQCMGDAALGLAVGKPVTVLQDALIRAMPGTSGQVVGRGQSRAGGISGGPTCLDGLVWWEVDINGAKGWTAEQDQNKTRLLLDR
jgi:hypothetical protein